MLLRKINEIRKALDTGLYNCALALTLTLPDICGKVAFPTEQSAAKRYKGWFETYAKPEFTAMAKCLPDGGVVENTWLEADECWALHCAVLHAGNYDVENVDLKTVRVHAHKPGGYVRTSVIRDEYYADIDVVELCEVLCKVAERYYDETTDKSRFVLGEVRIIV